MKLYLNSFTVNLLKILKLLNKIKMINIFLKRFKFYIFEFI
jgi:hypothetical protein